MTTASPLISSAESIYELPNILSRLGYESVFDVICQPREQFVLQHRNALGLKAGPVFDLIVGYAHQVIRLHRQSKTTEGTQGGAYGPFSQPGPDFANQFLNSDVGWKDRARSGAPEANDSPVAYLVYIYAKVLEKQKNLANDDFKNALKDRRPDIGGLIVDNASINEEIRQIELVNEVVSSAIQSALGLQNTVAVNALLATTRFPFALPFDYANQQIRVVESTLNLGLPNYLLSQEIELYQDYWSPLSGLTADQSVDLVRLQIMSSQLGPEEQKIIAEPAYFGNYHFTLSDLDVANKYWKSCSISDLFVNATNVEGAFILPLQGAVVTEYAGRPKQTEHGVNENGTTFLQINLTDGKSYKPIRLKSWHEVGVHPQVPVNVIVPENLLNNVLCLSYSAKDNPGLDFSNGPWYGQFVIQFSMYAEVAQPDNIGRDLTISLCFSDDTKTTYTSEQTNFYIDNFGDGSLDVDKLSSMDVLTSCTELTVPEVETMFCATAGGATSFTIIVSDNFVPPNYDAGDEKSLYPSCAAPLFFGARFINAGMEPCISLAKSANDGSLQIVSLTDDRLDRINRMVRLQRWLALPFEDVDLLVTSTIAAEGAGNLALLMNDNTLRMIGVFNHYKNTYGVSAKMFSAWLYTITPFAVSPEVPFFDQVFNRTGTFDGPLVADRFKGFEYSAVTGSDAVYAQKISTALGINRREFIMLADEIWKYSPYIGDQGTAGVIFCNLFVLSAFYRFASLASTLGMSVADFFALAKMMDNGTNIVLKQLAGLPNVSNEQASAPFASDFINLLQAFSTISQWIKQRQLTVPGVLAMLAPAGPQQTNAAGTAYQFAFIQDVWQQLPNTLVEPALLKRSGAPTQDDSQTVIDWRLLLGASSPPLIDDDGFVTDAADDTSDLPIDGAKKSIIVVIQDVVNKQKLTSDEKNQAMLCLNAVILKARQTQTGVATSLLAKGLNVVQPLAGLLLYWSQLTPYVWLSRTWALKETVRAPADIPDAYLNDLEEIGRRALVCRQFSLSPAALQRLLAQPTQFGLSPSYKGEVTFDALYVFGRYDDLLHQVGASSGGTEDDVLTYMQKAGSSPPLDKAKAAELLAALIGWTADQVQACWAVLGGIAMSVADIDSVLRLQQVQRETGLTVVQQQQAFSLNRDSGYDAWKSVGQTMVAGASVVKGAG